MHGHGGIGEYVIEEPNLVPLLDLVLQMVMFFMAVTNFAMENVNESIKLPLAQSAKPIEDVGTDILYMNVDHQGNLLVTRDNTYRDGKIDGMKGKQFDDNGNVASAGIFDRPLRNRQIESYLKRTFADNKLLAERRKDEPGTVRTLVILRADRDSKFNDVYEVLRICRSVGFKKMQMRATIDQK